MSKDYAEKLESTWAKTRAEREAREAAQLAADSVPTENIAVLKERATRHAYESTDGYWGHFNDIQTALAQTVITPLLDTISRLIAERDALTSAPVESAGDETGEAERLRAELERVRAELAKYVGAEPTIAEEMAHISRCLIAVQDVCRQAKRAGNRWVSVATVEQAVDGERPENPDDNRRRLYIDGRGNAWISTCVEGGVERIVPVQPAVWVEGSVEEIAAETGGLREIGRCW